MQRMKPERKAELKRTFRPYYEAEVVYELLAFLDEAEAEVDALRSKIGVLDVLDVQDDIQ